MTQPGIIQLSLAAGLSFLISACAGKAIESFSTPHNNYQLTNTAQLNSRQRADLFEAIITADTAAQNKDYQTATSYYLFAAEQSKSLALTRKAIQSSKLAKDPLGLEQAAMIWLSIEPNSNEAQTVLLGAQLTLQDIKRAMATAQTLFIQNPTSEARYNILNRNVLTQSTRNAFSFLGELHKKYPQEAAIATAQAKLILQLTHQSKNQESIYYQALNRIEQALTMSPSFIPAIKTKTQILFRLHKDNEARNFLHDKLSVQPNSVALSHLYGQLLYDLRRYKAAIKHYQKWVTTHRKDKVSHYYLAASHYALGNFEQSYRQFSALVDKNYQPNVVAFYCGDTAVKIGKIKEALYCFSLVEKGPFFASAKVQQANILANENRTQQALALLKQPYDIPKNQQAKLILAEVELTLHKIDKTQAAARLEQAIRDFPANIAFILKKIEIHQLASKPDELIELLKKAQDLLTQGKKRDKFNLAAAGILHNKGHIQQSIDWLDEALKANPTDKDLLYARVMYKESLGLYDEMVKELKQLNKLYPEDLSIQNALGYTLADLGIELDFAEKLIEAALKALPNNSAVIDSKGWLAFRQGKLNEAVTYLTRAFENSPSAEIAAHLGEVLWKLGRQQTAKSVWQQGNKLDKHNKVLKKTLERFNISD